MVLVIITSITLAKENNENSQDLWITENTCIVGEWELLNYAELIIKSQ